MIKKIQNIFSLSESGAKGVLKAAATSIAKYFAYMLPIFILMYFLDSVLSANIGNPMIYTVILILCGIIMHVVIHIDYDALYTATYKEAKALRIEIADVLKELPLSYFSTHNLSDLAQTIMQDVADIEHAMSHAIPQAIGFVFYFAIISILMLIGNVKMGLAILIPLLFSLVLIIVSKRGQIRETTVHYHKLRDNSEKFQEAIEMQQEIRSYSIKEEVLKTLEESIDESEKIHIRAEVFQAIPVNLSSALIKFSFGSAIFFGTLLFLNGEISVVYLLGYLLAAGKIMAAMEGLHMNLAEIMYIDARIKRIKEIRSVKTQKGEPCTLENFDIEFKDVEFSYRDNKKVVDGVSFTCKQGEVTALVGPSGCGKTSILRLASRLYDYDEGRILIDGTDIKKINTESLFSNISIVFQNVVLFDASVLENIRIGNPKASDQEVMHAARLANCEDFVDKLPEGYHTLIGENGSKLSGGERQRISIARAFLKDAPIILLDEISASLDVVNEMKIQESLNKLIKNKTVIIVSHRMKSIENADKIIVMNDGKIDAIGTHQHLLEASEVYSRMIKKSELTDKYQY